MLPNHGVIVVSECVQEATILAIGFEEAARFHLEAQHYGAEQVNPEESARLKSGMAKSALGRETWFADLRRLRRSDPDLFEGTSPQVVEAATAAGKDRALAEPADGYRVEGRGVFADDLMAIRSQRMQRIGYRAERSDTSMPHVGSRSRTARDRLPGPATSTQAGFSNQ